MENHKRWLTFSIALIVGVLFIAMGVARAEQHMVLEKAIRICLECIGLG